MFGSVVIFGKAKAEISVVPFQSGTLTYTGATLSPVWNGFDRNALEISGTTSAVNAGTYTATFTPKEGYVWSDGSTSAKSVTWTIQKAGLTVPSQNGSLTYTGSAQSPTWNNYNSSKLTIGGTTSGTNAASYNATFTPKAGYQWTDGSTMAKTVSWTIGKAAGSLSLSKTSLALSGTTPTGTFTVTRKGTGAITAASSNTSVATVSVSGTTVTVKALREGSATITVKVAADTNYTAPANKTCSVTATNMAHIYGVSWDGTSTTKWTRTDDAAGFTDPVPYVAGATSYSSPFDDLQPWKGMVKSERTGGTMVAIPKFWYKLEQNTPDVPSSGMTIKIADAPVEGFAASPAHMDRGDGKGERDVVYVGRYHCAVSGYESKTGEMPRVGITREDAWKEIHKLGSSIWQMDFATRFTLWLLYLVEFADWNSQKTIGYGCGNSRGTENMGYTDSMPYHTGTTQSSRDTYGLGTQYRNIEGLWDNVYDWCDGCSSTSDGLVILLNPDNRIISGRPSVGEPITGIPTRFTVFSAGGFTMFIPTAVGGSYTTHSCDGWSTFADAPCVCVGGYYECSSTFGLFSASSCRASRSEGNIGTRLMELT